MNPGRIPADVQENEDQPDLLSVVIPARNEESSISACLESVLAQDYPRLEVLVVDGASEDGTRELVRSHAKADPRVLLLDNPQRTIPAALNVGLAAARGRWLVRVDAHSTVPAEYVSRAVAHLKTSRWGGVGGRKDAVGLTPAGRAIAAVLGSPFGVGGSTYHHGTAPQTVDHVPFGAYPTDLVRALGGWDERVLANEDFELDHRVQEAGYELLFDPKLRIEWRCQQTIGGLFSQYRRYGRGKALVALLHPESVNPRHLGPPALVALLLGCALGRSRQVALSVLLPYGAFVAWATASIAPELPDRTAQLRVPLVFPALHLGYGIGFWESLLRVGKLRSPSGAGAGP